MTARETTVAIVGGGLSGLYAARLLQEAGIDFQLLEARERFGGRILSVDEKGIPSSDGFDLGPSWYWPRMHPRMDKVVRELGLQGFQQYSTGDAVIERNRSEAPQRFPAMRQEPQPMRISGGTYALVAALVGVLPMDRLHLGTRVSGIALSTSGLLLSASGSDTHKELAARQVILTLPPRLLAASVAFDPALDRATLERWRQTATWMAPHAKFFALYDRPFWREAGLSGTAQSGAGPLVEIHDSTSVSGAAALFGFVGLSRRQRISVGEDAMVRASIVQLTRLFGASAAQPRATLFKDWTADSFTSTEADEIAGGHPVPDSRPWMTGDWADCVSLAGSETSTSDPGYLAGALDAAERAVREIRDRLGC